MRDVQPLRRAADEVHVKLKAPRVYNAESEEPISALIDFAMELVATGAFGELVFIDLKKDYVVNYDIRSHVIKQNTKNHPCLTTSNGAHCDSKLECLTLRCAEHIRQSCDGCTPLSWFSFYDEHARMANIVDRPLSCGDCRECNDVSGVAVDVREPMYAKFPIMFRAF